MEKQQKIEQYLSEPVKVGDFVEVRGRGTQNKEAWGHTVEVLEVPDSEKQGQAVVVKGQYGKGTEVVAFGDWRKSTRFIGENPMVEKPWNSKLHVVRFDLGGIIHRLTRDRVDDRIGRLNWNPTILDSNGQEVEYQRDFVWSLEQKQRLIESIYNYINIGMIVVRHRSYEYAEKRADSGKPAFFYDIVDGKQRLNAILGFVNNEFSDAQGRYFKDFSDYGQRVFENFNQVSYAELGEDTTDLDIKKVFLGINVEGTPQDPKHIEFVKSINV